MDESVRQAKKAIHEGLQMDVRAALRFEVEAWLAGVPRVVRNLMAPASQDKDPTEYDQLRREIFTELAPEGSLNCIFVKNVVDYLWEFRRMKKLKHTAINYAMPDAATKLLTSSAGLWGDPDEAKVKKQAKAAAYGAANEAGGTDFAERMHSKHVSPEMIHFKALNSVSEELHWISRECERLEGRFHRLLKDFEGRRTALAAMAKSLVEREKAEVVNFKGVA